jgi:feoA domain
MQLPKAKKFTPLCIVSVSGDMKTKKHLETLGLTPGIELELLSTECGAAIFRIHGSRLALDYETANLVEVENISPSQDIRRYHAE